MSALFLRLLITTTLVLTLARILAEVAGPRRPRLRGRIWAWAPAVALVAALAPVPRPLAVNLPVPAPMGDVLRAAGLATSIPVGQGEGVTASGIRIRGGQGIPATHHVIVRQDPAPLARAALGLWAAGGILLSLLFGARAIGSWRWARALPLHDASAPTPVHLAPSDDSTAPCVTGLRTPRIVIPVRLLGEHDALDVVLRHELVHVRRGDLRAEQAYQLLVALAWWNPLVWLSWRHARLARELAADADVLAQGVAPTRYLDVLLAVRRDRVTPTLAMAGNGPLGTRIRALPDAALAAHESPRTPRLALVAAVILAITIAAARPTLTVPRPAERPDAPPDAPRVELRSTVAERATRP